MITYQDYRVADPDAWIATFDLYDGHDNFSDVVQREAAAQRNIEVARALASMPVPPRRSIVFVAVTGEEHGLLGSDYFAHYPTVPSSAIVANVNIECPRWIQPWVTVPSSHLSRDSLRPRLKSDGRTTS